MAAGRDIARHTRLIRREQVARNLEALKEAEARRTEQEALSEMSPSEIRRRATQARVVQRAKRSGHHRVGEIEERMMGAGSIEDKMDRGGEDKGALWAALFASPQAQALAEGRGIVAEFLATQEPSSQYGFTKGDIEGYLPEAEAPPKAPPEGKAEEGRETLETEAPEGEGADGGGEVTEGEGTREEGGEASEVLYASPEARALSEAEGLTDETLAQWAPSSPLGFTKGDIEDIAAAEADGEGEG